jgi:hypothetical protein
MPKNIVVFKIDKKIDFKNHLISAGAFSRRTAPGGVDVVYYKKLLEANAKNRQKLFNKKAAWFYLSNKKNIRDLAVRQVQEAWGLVEKKYIKRMEKIHGRKFPFKKIRGILSTAAAFGYGFQGDKSWFACRCDSSLGAINTAMHEIMHLIFFYYYFNKWMDKFLLTWSQMWAIKESFTVLLNIECADLRIKKDNGYAGHEKVREKISKDWKKYKNFEKVLDKACEYVKKNKLFL